MEVTEMRQAENRLGFSYRSDLFSMKTNGWLRIGLLCLAFIGLNLVWSFPSAAADEPSGTTQSGPWIDRTSASGMTILLQKTKSPVVEITLLLKSGSGLDPADKKGTALIMNNLVYLKLGNVKAKIGDVSVATYPDYSLISFKTSPGDAKKALTEVKELLSYPLYSYDVITDLKGLYRTDVQGMPVFNRVYYDLTRELYGSNHPYNDWIDSDSLAAIEGKDVYRWYRQTYQPGNAILSISGGVRQSIRDLEKFFAAMNTEAVDRRLMISPVTLEENLELSREERNGRVTSVGIGFAAPRLTDPEYPAFRVIAYYLEDYLHYFEELRVKQGLIYAGFVLYDYLDKPKAPSLTFLTVTDPELLPRVEAKTLEVLDRLRTAGMDPDQIQQVVQAMKRQNEAKRSEGTGISVRNALSQYLQNRLVYDENLLPKLEKVQTQDIMNAATKYLTHYVRVAYVPQEQAANF